MVKGRNSNVVGWTFAVIAVVCGVALSIYAARVSSTRMRRLRRKLVDLKVVRAMQQQSKANVGAVQVFESLPSRRVTPLRDVLQASMPDVSAEVRERDSIPAESGWVLRRAEVVFNDVLLEQVGVFIQTAETQRPPWRLYECNVVASERGDKSGRVTLVMEALEKTGDSDS